MKTKSSFIKNNKRRIALLCLVALFAVMSVLTMGNFNVGIPSIAADNRLIFVQVEAGEDFAIGLTIDGEIYGWSLIRGSNSDFGWQDNRHIFTSDDEGVHVYEMSQRTLGQFYPGIPTRIPVTFRGMRSIDNSPWHLQGIGGNEIEDRIVQIATTRTAAAFITQRGFIYTWGSDPATMGIELEVAGGTQTTRPWQNGILHRNIMSSTVTGPNPYGSRQYYIPKQNPSFFTPDLIDTLSFRYFDSSGGPVGLGHGAGIGHGLAIEFDNNTDANGIGTNSRRAIGIWGGVDNFVVERADSQFVAWGNMTYMQIPVEGIGYPTPIVGHLDSPGVGGRVVAGAGFVAHIAEVGVDNLSIRGRNYHVPFFGAAGIPLGAGAAFLSRDNSVRGGVPHDPGRTLYGEFANGFFPLINTSLGQDVLLNLDGQLVENLWVEWNNQGYGYLDYGNFNRPSNAVALRNALIPTFQTAPGVSVRATASNPSVPFFGTAGGDFNVARNRMSNNMTNVALGNGIVYFIDSSNNVRFFGTDYNNSHNVSTGHANASGATFTGLPAGDWRQVVAGQVPMGANTALIRDDNAIVGYDTLFRRGADLLLGGNPVGMDISWGHSISKVETLVGATSLNLLPVDGNPFHWYDFAGHGIQNSHISAALLDEVQNIGGANRQVWAWNRDGNSTGNIVADTGGWVHFHNFRLSENHQIATISSGYGNNLFAISSQGVMFRIQWEANFTYGGQTGLFVARAMTEFQDENGDTLEGWSTRGLANALSVDFRVNMNCVGCRPRAAGQPLVACDENCNRTAAQHSTDNPVRVNVGYQTPTGGVSPHDLTRLNVYGTLPIAQRAGLADDRFSIYEDSRLGHAYRLLLTDPRSDTIVPHLVPGATQIPPVTRGDFAENVETFVPVGHFGMFRKGENPNLVGDYMTANPTLPLNRSWSMNPFDNQFFGIEIDNFVSGSRNLSFTITPRQSTQGETIRLVFWIGRVDNISTLGFADETAPNSNIFNANPDLMVYEARPVVLEINIGNTPFEVVWSDERLDSNENELDQNSTVSLLDPNVSYNRHYSVAVHNVSAGFETLGTQIARISNSTPEGSNPTVGQINAIVPYFQFAAYRSDEGFPSRTYTGTNRNAAGAIPQATALTQANWGAGMDRQNQLSYTLGEDRATAQFNNIYSFMIQDIDADLVVLPQMIDNPESPVRQLVRTIQLRVDLRDILTNAEMRQRFALYINTQQGEFFRNFNNRYGFFNMSFNPSMDIGTDPGILILHYQVLVFSARVGSIGTNSVTWEGNNISSPVFAPNHENAHRVNVALLESIGRLPTTIPAGMNIPTLATRPSGFEPLPHITVHSQASLRLVGDFRNIAGVTIDSTLINETVQAGDGQTNFVRGEAGDNEAIVRIDAVVGQERTFELSYLVGNIAGRRYAYNANEERVYIDNTLVSFAYNRSVNQFGLFEANIRSGTENRMQIELNQTSFTFTSFAQPNATAPRLGQIDDVVFTLDIMRFAVVNGSVQHFGTPTEPTEIITIRFIIRVTTPPLFNLQTGLWQYRIVRGDETRVDLFGNDGRLNMDIASQQRLRILSVTLSNDEVASAEIVARNSEGDTIRIGAEHEDRYRHSAEALTFSAHQNGRVFVTVVYGLEIPGVNSQFWTTITDSFTILVEVEVLYQVIHISSQAHIYHERLADAVVSGNPGVTFVGTPILNRNFGESYEDFFGNTRQRGFEIQTRAVGSNAEWASVPRSNWPLFVQNVVDDGGRTTITIRDSVNQIETRILFSLIGSAGIDGEFGTTTTRSFYVYAILSPITRRLTVEGQVRTVQISGVGTEVTYRLLYRDGIPGLLDNADYGLNTMFGANPRIRLANFAENYQNARGRYYFDFSLNHDATEITFYGLWPTKYRDNQLEGEYLPSFSLSIQCPQGQAFNIIFNVEVTDIIVDLERQQYVNILWITFLVVLFLVFLLFLIRLLVYWTRRSRQRKIVAKNQMIIKMRDKVHNKETHSQAQVVKARMNMDDKRYQKMYTKLREEKEVEAGIVLTTVSAQKAEKGTKKKKKGGKRSIEELKEELAAKRAQVTAMQTESITQQSQDPWATVGFDTGVDNTYRAELTREQIEQQIKEKLGSEPIEVESEPIID